MRLAYSLLLYLAAPILWLREQWHAQDRARAGERFGHAPVAPGVETWVHAVSVGEVMAALPLIRALVAQRPGTVLVTTTTATGSARVREQLADSVRHCYAPYDLPHVVRRFLDRVRPSRVVIMETELWPNLFRELRERNVPLLIANGRLSPRSFPRYRVVRPGLARVLADCSLIAAQSEADAQRFRALGAAPGRVQVMGNLKFDFELSPAQVVLGRQWRARLGAGRPAWIAASTHEGEERAALEAHRALRAEFADALLVLVPRHPQRFEAVARRVRESGLPFRSRSTLDSAPAPDSAAVLLGDSMGEMVAYYAAADVAFVGGSLVPVGGHNVLEPAAVGLPVIFGPHMFNFAPAQDLLLERGAAKQVAGAAELATAVAGLWRDPGERQRMAAAGQAAVEANRGALRRFLDLLESVAPQAPQAVGGVDRQRQPDAAKADQLR